MIDLTTLYIMVAFGGVVAGIVHIVPWATGWFGRWAAWWGFGHVALGLSALGAVLRELGAPEGLVMLGNPLAVLAYAAVYCGARGFCGLPSRTPLLMAFAVIAALPLLLWTDRDLFPMRVAYLSVIRSMFDAATVVLAIRIARTERLHTAWIMAVMFAATVPMFLGRAWLALTGRIGTQLIGTHDDAAGWLAAGQICFILFRGFALFALEAERGRNALAAMAERDALTGALNRTGFERRRAGWTGDGAVLVVDLDRFKALNDRCGHAAGDAVLRIAADVARDGAGCDATVIRWGGDEFVCVLPGATLDTADAVAARIRQRFHHATRATVSPDIAVAASIGIACGRLTDVVALVSQADAAMYADKARGRYEPTPRNAALPKTIPRVA